MLITLRNGFLRCVHICPNNICYYHFCNKIHAKLVFFRTCLIMYTKNSSYCKKDKKVFLNDKNIRWSFFKNKLLYNKLKCFIQSIHRSWNCFCPCFFRCIIKGKINGLSDMMWQRELRKFKITDYNAGHVIMI